MDQQQQYEMMHARYEELVAKFQSGQPLSKEESLERVQLFYELTPELAVQYDVTPEQAMGGRAAQRGIFKLL